MYEGQRTIEAIDKGDGILAGAGGQVRVSGGSQDRRMTENLLHLEQVDARLDRMGRVSVATMYPET